MKISPTDTPRELLTIAARRMPEDRRDWGVAMLAEPGQIHDPASRWRFALGCTYVALFPPLKGELLHTMGNHTMKTITTTLRSAALISFILVLLFAILESLNNTITKQNAPGLVLLFGLLWVLPTAFIVVLVPIVQTVRAGNSIMAKPINLLFRVGFLILIAMIWGGLFIDQLPCFLGVPNCD